MNETLQALALISCLVYCISTPVLVFLAARQCKDDKKRLKLLQDRNELLQNVDACLCVIARAVNEAVEDVTVCE